MLIIFLKIINREQQPTWDRQSRMHAAGKKEGKTFQGLQNLNS
jgi:hypothetical protein